MKQKKNLRTWYGLVLLSGVFFLLCSLFGTALHSSLPSALELRCDTACHQHNSGPAASLSTKSEQDDETEPKPPVFAWQLSDANLALRYIVPFVPFVAIAVMRKKFLLTTQLRF